VKKISEDYNKWTVKQLREFCNKNNIKLPSKARKADIIKMITEFTSSSEDLSEVNEEKGEDIKNNQAEVNIIEEQEGIFEEELIAGFDEDDDPALLYKDQMDLKFWQQPEFRVLLDIELAKDSKVAFYDLSSLVDKFFNNMLHEEFINYKISGIALKSAATLHHYKISSIIKEEEMIQKKVELEKLRARHARTIPKALPQPIQPKMQIATKRELFDAMRAMIIETMQNKEKLKRRRLRREEEKQRKIQMKSKARLPKELLKHISGKDQTVEELHESWLNRIKGTINLNNKTDTSFFDLMEIIKNDEISSIGRRFALVRMFLALMFLSTSGASGTSKTSTDIELFQEEDFKDIQISLK